jgi:uncharacterized protein DUF4190
VNSTGTTCPQCGRPLTHEPRFCSFCGRRLGTADPSASGTGPASPARSQPGDAPGAPGGAREGGSPLSRIDGYAAASIVCAVAGLFALPVVGPILGIVFGKKALRNIEDDPTLEGAGLAQAGIIVGWVGLLVSLVVMAGVLVVFAPVFTSSNY